MAHRFSKTPFLLVTGQARSGTTILTKAVGRHPEVLSNLRESNYLRDVLDLLSVNRSNASRVRQMVVETDQFIGEFRNALLNVAFPDSVVDEHGFGERLPRYVSTFSSLRTEFDGTLEILFPNIFVLNIVRNGIEVVASRMNHRNIGVHSFEQHCHAWAASVGTPKWGEGRENFFLVRHEDLLGPDRNRTVFSQFFNQSGLSDSDHCSDFCLSTLINTTEQGGDQVESPLNLNSRSKRWMAWSDAQRSQFETICQPAMEYFGYSIPWL